MRLDPGTVLPTMQAVKEAIKNELICIQLEDLEYELRDLGLSLREDLETIQDKATQIEVFNTSSFADLFEFAEEELGSDPRLAREEVLDAILKAVIPGWGSDPDLKSVHSSTYWVPPRLIPNLMNKAQEEQTTLEFQIIQHTKSVKSPPGFCIVDDDSLPKTEIIYKHSTDFGQEAFFIELHGFEIYHDLISSLAK